MSLFISFFFFHLAAHSRHLSCPEKLLIVSHWRIITMRPTKCSLSLIFLLEQWFRNKAKPLQVTQTYDKMWGKERKRERGRTLLCTVSVIAWTLSQYEEFSDGITSWDRHREFPLHPIPNSVGFVCGPF